MKQRGNTMQTCAIEWHKIKGEKTGWQLEKKAKGVQDVLTEVTGEDIQAKASYDIPTKTTSIAVVDEDPDSIQIIAQSIPLKIDKVIVEELPSSGVTSIKTEGKEKEVVTIVADLPKVID